MALPSDPERLVEHGAGLRRLARRLLADPHAAEDVVQEAWVAALRRPPGEGVPLRPWLARVVRNLALTRRREEGRRRGRERVAARGEALPPAAESAGRIEVARRLLDAVRALDEPYRTAIVLRFLEGHPLRAVARRTGVPVETARSRIRRGLARLRERLDPGDEERRREHLRALGPLAARPLLPHSVAAALAAMSTKKAVLAAAALVLVLAAGLRSAWRAEPEEPRIALPPPSVPASGVATHAGGADDGSGAQIVATKELATRSEVGAAVGDAAWTASGRVLLATGEPVGGARVAVRLLDAVAWPEVVLQEATSTSDAEGAFAAGFEVPAGTVRVRAEVETPPGPTAGGAAERTVYAGDAEPSDFVVQLLPLDLEVSGRVVDEEGRPVAGAKVEASYRMPRATTGADGTYRLLASTWRTPVLLRARGPGGGEGFVYVQPVDASTLRAPDLVLSSGRRIAGRVVDEEGAGVAGSRVGVGSSSLAAATEANEDGRFVLEEIGARERFLHAVAEGFAPSWTALPESGDALIELRRGVELRGRVLREDGEPVAGARLTAASWSRASDPVPRTLSARDGTFRLRCVPEAAERLWAARAGLVPAWLDLDASTTGEEELEIVMSAGRALEGVVVDEEGAPVPFALVYAELVHDVHGRLDAGESVRSSEEGSFRFAALPEEPITIGTMRPGHVRESVRVDPGAVGPLTIVLRRAGVVSGRVVDGFTGAAVESFEVRLGTSRHIERGDPFPSLRSAWREGVAFIGTDGAWRTELSGEMPVGAPVSVEVSAPGYGTALVDPVIMTAEATHDVVVELFPPAAVSGVVADAETGAPIEGALVRLVPAGVAIRELASDALPPEGEQVATSDVAGGFAFEDVAPGRHRLVAQADGLAPAIDRPFERAADAPVHRVLALHPGARLRGRLLRHDGEPRAAETISLWSRGPVERRLQTTTDAEGRFELAGLGAGEYGVAHFLSSGRNAGGVYATQATVTVPATGTVDVELRPPGTAVVRGTVAYEGDLPAGAEEYGFSGTLLGRDADGSWFSMGSAVQDDAFSFDGVPAGTYTLFVTSYGAGERVHGEVEIEVVEGELHELVVPLERSLYR